MKEVKHTRLAMTAMTSILALGFGSGAMAVEPQEGKGAASTLESAGGITPYIIFPDRPKQFDNGGNRTCEDVGDAFFGNVNYYSCSSARANYTGTFDAAFTDVSGNPDCDNNAIDVTVTDGTSVAFTANPDGVGAAIVKGGPAANVYVYDPQQNSDSGLTSPVNISGNPAGLSNLTFCWNPVGQETECFEDETAWAAGNRYTLRGNWATYTSYEGAAKTVTLFAGQTMEAGTVQFSAPAGDHVTITITLNEGWRFALNPAGENEYGSVYDNNIKVQDYATAPSGNPAPGLFQWKTIAEGQTGSITVNAKNFYGVHVDVEHQVDCPVPETPANPTTSSTSMSFSSSGQ
jgi:hypothetical protein